MYRLPQPIFRVKNSFLTKVKDIISFFSFLFYYIKKHVSNFFLYFEDRKNVLVKFLMMKRGRYNRPFLHLATIVLLGLGVMITPILTDTFPLFSGSNSISKIATSATAQEQSIAVDNNVFQTQTSDKVRDKIITYTVARGDTISTIAEKFGISEDSIRWENNITGNDISVGDTLQILPVSGIAYKVQKGDSVYTIADKFSTNAQKIVDFPFNEFANPETFSLVEGQILIVPDGVKPSEKPAVEQTYIAAGPLPNVTPSAGGFIWPIAGILTQYFSWYHSGIDIAGAVGTPIVAAKSGVVAEASCGWNYGYGCHVLIDNGGGYSTMYAHMVQQPSVSVGQSVSGGQLIGYRGSTGRSTGPHTHFEVRIGGHAVNPLPYLQ